MARKKRAEEHENLERWLVSYADFITLLFAFFVVMYAISQVNEGKYRVLSDSLQSAFEMEPKTISPFQMGDPGPSSDKPKLSDSDRIGKSSSVVDSDASYEQTLSNMSNEVQSNLQDMIEKGLISVRTEKNWIEIEINSSVLFGSGNAQISESAKPLLRILARVLGKFPHEIKVEGFTDNQPISNRFYPSNWELSAARAASVVRLFEGNGIAAERLSAVGYGSTRPIASNDTEWGRNKNRRVVLIVSREHTREAVDVLNRRRNNSQTTPQPESQNVEVTSPEGSQLQIDPGRDVTNTILNGGAQ
jgi:chemotaxis protein MotB